MISAMADDATRLILPLEMPHNQFALLFPAKNCRVFSTGSRIPVEYRQSGTNDEHLPLQCRLRVRIGRSH